MKSIPALVSIMKRGCLMGFNGLGLSAQLGRGACALLISMAALTLPGRGFAASGYVGVFQDSTGTVACTVVQPYTGTTLYVLATLDGETGAGISGAEFRIEVSDPTGWLFSYFPPTGSLAIGNPIDAQPANAADGAGVDLAFPHCATPSSSGKVRMGTISVFNLSGSATSLTVKPHASPKNPFYMCPLFTKCDTPLYTKTCMTAALTPPCSTIAPNKSIAAASDPGVFAFLISHQTLAQPEYESITTTAAVGMSEVWMDGERVSGSEVSMSVDDSTIAFNGVSLNVMGRQPTLSEGEGLGALLTQVPRYQELRSNGLGVQAACDQYMAEVNAAFNAAHAAFVASGHAAAFTSLSASPLFDYVAAVSDGVFQTRQRGWRAKPTFNARVPVTGTDPDVLHRQNAAMLCSHVRTIESRLTSGERVVVVLGPRLNLTIYAGAQAEQAALQLRSARAGMPLSTIPSGPLRQGDSSLMRARSRAALEGKAK